MCFDEVVTDALCLRYCNPVKGRKDSGVEDISLDPSVFARWHGKRNSSSGLICIVNRITEAINIVTNREANSLPRSAPS